MLSRMVLKSAGAASKYYRQADYYTGNEKEDRAASFWMGKGAERLGLSGAVDYDTFKSALEGALPNGTILSGRGPDSPHRPGWDFTFSAPKSVSVAALVLGDERLIDAHEHAVRETISFIEENYADIRFQQLPAPTDNLLVAGFTHATSREGDPQLHTHSVILNASEREDGRWVALHGDRMNHVTLVFGSHYQSVLADSTTRLGYGISVDREKGTFEIQGIPDSVLGLFSKRREDIKSHMEANDLHGAEGAQVSALLTRPNKSRDGETLRDRWLRELIDAGLRPENILTDIDSGANPQSDKPSPSSGGERPDRVPASPAVVDLPHDGTVKPSPVTVTVQPEKPTDDPSPGSIDRTPSPQTIRPDGTIPPAVRPPTTSTPPDQAAFKAVDLAISLLSDREAVWRQDMLQTEAIRIGMGTVTPNHVLKVIKERQRDGTLIPTPFMEGRVNLRGFTTAAALTAERHLVDLERGQRNALSPLASKREVTLAVLKTDKNISAEQRKAIRAVLSTENRFSAIHGYAGTGKTTTLSLLLDVLDRPWYKQFLGNKAPTIYGVAPTASAAEKLGESLGIKTDTLDRFMMLAEQGKIERKSVWIVDEAGLASTKKAIQVAETAIAHDARVVFVGDSKQYGAIEQGKPLTSLIRHGMKTSFVTKIHRQRDNENLLNAVYAAVGGQIDKSLSLVKNETINLTSVEERINKAVGEYMALPGAERKDALLLILDNDTRTEVMKRVREQLKINGEIARDEKTVTILKPSGKTNTQISNPIFYKVGEVILFHRANKALGIERGEYYRVATVGENHLQIEGNGKSINWQPSASASVFNEEERQVSVGDRIGWTHNANSSSGVKNGYEGTIQSFKGNSAVVSFSISKGKELKRDIDLSNDVGRHWDLAYAKTGIKSQGLDAKNVIIIAESFRRNLMTQPAWYVGISRSTKTLKIITDNADKLREGLKKRIGEKTSAIEATSLVNPINVSASDLISKARESIRLNKSVDDQPTLIRR